MGGFNAKKYLKYNDSWKNGGMKDRLVKFILDKSPIHVINYINEKSNLISGWIWDGLESGTITQDNIIDSRNFELQLQKQWRTILDTKSSNWERSLIRAVLERYKSSLLRNGKLSKSKIRFRSEKAVKIYDNLFKDKKTHLELKMPGVEKQVIKINYYVPGTMNKYQPYLTKGMGGNLVKGKIFSARAKVPIKWKYVPKDVIGIDLNLRSDVFCVWSNGDVIQQSPVLVKLIEDMKSLNKEINNKKKRDKDGNKIVGALNTKQRKRRRLRLQKMHKQQQKMIDVYVNQLIDYAEQNELMVAIDDARTGATNGSYGQDKFIVDSIRQLENRCIPHILVPTPHSTKMCNQCDAKTERPTNEKVVCPNCGEIDADLNGAKNIARFGWKIWNEGIKEFWNWKKSVYK